MASARTTTPASEATDPATIDITSVLATLANLLQTRQPEEAAPHLDEDAIISAAREALTDRARPFQNRDLREVEVLLAVVEDIDREPEAAIAKRLQLLLTARSHGWAYATRVAQYEEDRKNGLYAAPPAPPSKAPTRGRGRGRGRGGRGRGGSAAPKP